MTPPSDKKLTGFTFQRQIRSKFNVEISPRNPTALFKQKRTAGYETPPSAIQSRLPHMKTSEPTSLRPTLFRTNDSDHSASPILYNTKYFLKFYVQESKMAKSSNPAEMKERMNKQTNIQRHVNE